MAKQKIPSLTKMMTEDLENFRKVWVGEAAKIARDELTETAKEAIRAFYRDYTPSDYQRHYYNFLTNSFKPLYKNNHRVTYSGGIWITLDELDQIYRGDATMIGEQVYAGEHGHWETLGTDMPTPVMSPSPMEIIMNKYNEMVVDFSTGGARWARAYNAGASQTFKIISFS